MYKAAFPNGILQTIQEKYLRSPKLVDGSVVTIIAENSNGEKPEAQYVKVNEDKSKENEEDLKEVPITDDYVYDQPIEDRFTVNKEDNPRNDEESKTDDARDSKNQAATQQNQTKNISQVIVEEKPRNKELSKYGATFGNWITKFFEG